MKGSRFFIRVQQLFWWLWLRQKVSKLHRLSSRSFREAAEFGCVTRTRMTLPIRCFETQFNHVCRTRSRRKSNWCHGTFRFNVIIFSAVFLSDAYFFDSGRVTRRVEALVTPREREGGGSAFGSGAVSHSK